MSYQGGVDIDKLEWAIDDNMGGGSVAIIKWVVVVLTIIRTMMMVTVVVQWCYRCCGRPYQQARAT